MLRIRFFGTAIVTLDSQPLSDLTRSPLLINLLAYLLCGRHRSHSRSVLAALFWPDLPESRSRQYLSLHLWRLRKTLPTNGTAQYVLSDSQTIQFNPAVPLWLDIAEFEAATAPLLQMYPPQALLCDEDVRQLEGAVELYRGDFLEGVYADWCLGLREQLRERYLLALEMLARSYQMRGQYEAALQAARQLECSDPLREEGHIQLIQLYAQLGRPRLAQAQYLRYETIWRDELKLPPSPHVQALLHQLDHGGSMGNGLQPHDGLGQDIRLIEGLLTALGAAPDNSCDPQACLVHEVLRRQIAEYAERVGYALKARRAYEEALLYFTLAADTLLFMLPASPENYEREANLRGECDEVRLKADYQRWRELSQQFANSRLDSSC